MGTETSRTLGSREEAKATPTRSRKKSYWFLDSILSKFSMDFRTERPGVISRKFEKNHDDWSRFLQNSGTTVPGIHTRQFQYGFKGRDTVARSFLDSILSNFSMDFRTERPSVISRKFEKNHDDWSHFLQNSGATVPELHLNRIK